MRIKVASVVCVLLCAGLLAGGCAERQPATFQHYEREGTGRYTSDTNPGVAGTFADREITTPTDRASIALDGGGEVVAGCPFEGLEGGDKVTAQQNQDGTWVVVSVP